MFPHPRAHTSAAQALSRIVISSTAAQIISEHRLRNSELQASLEASRAELAAARQRAEDLGGELRVREAEVKASWKGSDLPPVFV